MSPIRCAALFLSLLILSIGAPQASVEPGDAANGRLAVGDVLSQVLEVPAWDSSSPQHLVSIEGQLYQEDAGFYYRVIPGRITVRLAEGISDWQELLTRALADDASAFAALRSLVPERSNRLAIIDLRTPADADLPPLAELLFHTGLVRYSELATRGVWALTPNDPRYDEQWALNNTGQTGGTAGADIEAEAAWDLVAGDASIIVAVIDSGTDIDHEDLAPNVWHNPGEIQGNGVDDDGNGYVDDWEGWDFDNNNNDPRSTYFHGTHVTGIVNAATNNAIGIAGLAGGNGGPGVQGMALGVGENSPNGDVIDDAILYAADNGAHVITLSLSVSETQAINDALDYAYNTKDVFLDCASGNNGSSVGYPARRPEMMAVASSDHNDNKSGFSNPGPEVEVAAPGSDILSTQIGDAYGTSSGTSFAAPYVAGLAALVRSRNPGLPAPEVRQLIIDSAEDIGPVGYDEGTGHGRINAFEAVSLAANSNGIVRLDRENYSCEDQLRITVSDIDLAGDGTVEVLLSSQSESAGETIVLNETGSSSGVFRETVPVRAGTPVDDGQLQVSDGDTITVEYIDADDGEGGTNVSKTDTALADCRAPLVSAVEEQDVTQNSATITWTTDEASTSLVRYGATLPPTSEESSAGLVTAHSVPLTNLEECSIYKYEVDSSDALGNTVTDDNGGTYYSFETFGDFPGVGVIPCHRGQAQLDQEVYNCQNSVVASVTDLDLNADAGVVETVEVLITSTTEPGGEWIVLTELDQDNSRFEGSIIQTSGAPAADGLLQVSPGDLITVSYYDQDDGDGGQRTSTDTADADCVAPGISNVRVTQIKNSRAEIEWSTDEPATSRVEYGTTPALGQLAESSALVTEHALTLTGFETCARVHFRVESADARGDLSTADADGVPFAFNLNQIGGLLFYDGFESDTGWDLADEWELGQPQGLGSDASDPAAAYSGSSVLGLDLIGQGSFPGDYEPNSNTSATSPILDASTAQNLELIYRRRLGVRSGDQASVLTFTAGLTTQWTNPSTVNDGQWAEFRHDISGEADGRSSLRIVFQLEANDSAQSFGWNIDELIVKDATAPDYESCGGCAGEPSFAGLRSVEDPDACGPGGVDLNWSDASAWGTGNAGTYEVHRGESPGFQPDSSNRVQVGLVVTQWTDANAPVDTDLWYIVRARNNEACGGGGLIENNLVRIPARETTTRPAPGSPASSLTLSRVGAAHARLNWTPTADTAHSQVRRSESSDFSSPVDLDPTTESFFEDRDALTNAKNYFYRVWAVNACGEETP